MDLSTFLNELRETIISSPPYTDDWTGLDGAWCNRFKKFSNKVNVCGRNLVVSLEVKRALPSRNYRI